MKTYILLILITAFTLGACGNQKPPPSCHGTWTSLNDDFEFEPVPVVKESDNNDHQSK